MFAQATDLLMHLLRATGFLAISTILAAGTIHFAKPSSPKVQQEIWFLVLLAGLLFFPISIVLPWYRGAAPADSGSACAQRAFCRSRIVFATAGDFIAR